MYPNEKYPEYFPETAMPEELPEAYRSCCLKIGSYMIIRNVLEEYHLPQLLYKRLGSKCGLFLDLVSYLIVDEENAGQYYPDFAYSHPLFSEEMKIYSDSSVSRLLASIGKEQTQGFLFDWNDKRDQNSAVIFPMIPPTRTARQEISTWSSSEKPKTKKGFRYSTWQLHLTTA